MLHGIARLVLLVGVGEVAVVVVAAAVHVRRHLLLVALHAGAAAAGVLLEAVPRVLHLGGAALLEVEAVAAPHGQLVAVGAAA